MQKDLNIEIGKMMKILRKTRNMTQYDVSEKLGISTQQVHKYENGMDNFSVKILYEISNIFNCNISDFFVNCCNVRDNNSILNFSEKKEKFDYNMKETDIKDNEALDILKIYYSLKSNDRKKMLDYIKKEFCFLKKNS